MRLYAKGSFTGEYTAHGAPAAADCVIGHAFGIRVDDPGIVNRELADYIDANFSSLPILANQDIARVLTTPPAEVLTGDPSHTTGGGLGTWGELQQAKMFMKRNKMETAVLVGQAYHIGRIAL